MKKSFSILKLVIAIWLTSGMLQMAHAAPVLGNLTVQQNAEVNEPAVVRADLPFFVFFQSPVQTAVSLNETTSSSLSFEHPKASSSQVEFHIQKSSDSYLHYSRMIKPGLSLEKLLYPFHHFL